MRPRDLRPVPASLAWVPLLLALATFATPSRAGEATGTLEAEIVDAGTGTPLVARVHAVGSDGQPGFDPEGVRYERPGLLERAGTTGAHFVTAGPTFAVTLPAGEARVVVERGKEYRPLELHVVIEAGKTVTRRLALERWIDMADHGWYSGDTHVHRTLPELRRVLAAEDLNVAFVQTQWNTPAVPPEAAPWIAEAGRDGLVPLDRAHVVHVVGGEIEDWQGIGALGFSLPGPDGSPVEGVADFFNALRYLEVGRRVHEAGGIVEIEKPWWNDAPVHAALAEVALVGILNNHLVRGGFLPALDRPLTTLGMDHPPGELGYLEQSFALYAHYLNAGLRLQPTAGSASGVLPNPPGFNRVYVKVDGAFSYPRWREGLLAGRSFVTNGPMLFVEVEGATGGERELPRAGSLEVRGAVHTPRPLERIEIVRNGAVVKVLHPGAGASVTEFTAAVAFAESGWLAVRCFEKKVLNHGAAHSAPVHVTVAGRPFVPVRDSLERIVAHIEAVATEVASTPVDPAVPGRVKSEEHRRELIEMYGRAAESYRRRLADSR